MTSPAPKAILSAVIEAPRPLAAMTQVATLRGASDSN